MKKNILFLLAAAVIGFAIYKYKHRDLHVDEVSISEKGIHFVENTKWADVLNKAKAENKPIFLDIYATWCGPCKMLKKTTFNDEKVGSFFNKNFISVEMDGEKGEGIELAEKFQLEGYPSLYFLNPNGEILNQTAGYLDPNQLLEFAASVKK